jgi:hypothetical protein
VDSLLGIGVSGGKSASEGAKLAARLKEMQKERDTRAKVQKQTLVTASAAKAPTIPTSPIAGVTPVTNVPSSSGAKSKSKRKKKGKR